MFYLELFFIILLIFMQLLLLIKVMFVTQLKSIIKIMDYYIPGLKNYL